MTRVFLLFLFFCVQLHQTLWANPTPTFLSFEQRLILSYLIQAIGEPEHEQKALSDRLGRLIHEANQKPIDRITVSSTDEFLSHWKGNWPNTHRLDLDLKIIESNSELRWRYFTSESPEVRYFIAHYLKLHVNLFLSFLKANQIPVMNSFLLSFLNHLRAKQDDSPSLLTTQTLFLETSHLLSSQLNTLESATSGILNETGASGPNGGFRRIIQMIIEGYFQELSLDSKKQAYSLLLEKPLGASPLQRFQAIIEASDPLFQKLLQLIARMQLGNPQLRDLFIQLESGGRPVPWILIRDIIESEHRNYDFLHVDTIPLAVGSMAQVHYAKIRSHGSGEQSIPVVFRFLKPGIREGVAEGKRILTRLAPLIDADPLVRASNLPRFTPLVEDLSRTVEEELNSANTSSRQKQGRTAYTSSQRNVFKESGHRLNISVPYVIEPRTSETQLLVQEFITGKKLDEIADLVRDQIPNFKTKVIEALAKVWIQEILIGGGLYHADLHPGNFKIAIDGREIFLNILDFGMAGKLSDHMRENLLKLGFALELLKPDLITKAFWELSEPNKNGTSFNDFSLSIVNEVSKIKLGDVPDKKLSEWISFAMDLGLHFPYDFINLNRGYLNISNLLSETGSNLSLSLIARQVGTSHPIKLTKLVIQAGDISLLDILRLATPALFQSKEKPSLEITVSSDAPPKLQYLNRAMLRCKSALTGQSHERLR